MDPSIAKLKSTTFCGRRFTRKQLFDIQRTVHNFPALSRNELAQTICEHLQWHTPSGGYRVNACLTVLKNLEQLGGGAVAGNNHLSATWRSKTDRVDAALGTAGGH